MQVLDWLKQLIAIDTTSRHSNLKLIELLRQWFEAQAIPVRLTYDATGTKANLVATLPSQDGSINGGLLLSGHTDTVPVDGQKWDTDPYEAVVKDDLVYGRGTCDMKGFLAVCLSLVPEWQQQKRTFPIHLAFSYDEEVGCKGVPFIIDDLRQAGVTPKACIVGEPTMMRPVVAHKGIQGFRCQVTGVAAHSSLTHKGCNAIEYAAKLICVIRELADELRTKGPKDTHFDVPYGTVSTNTIKGGNADNIIPSECEFIFEYRNLPEVKPQVLLERIQQYLSEKLLPAMKSEQPSADVKIHALAVVPGFECQDRDKFTQLVNSICQNLETNKVAYATEAGVFQRAGIPTIVCGPGSIEQAHRPNEFVAVSQLTKCQDFLRQLVLSFT